VPVRPAGGRGELVAIGCGTVSSSPMPEAGTCQRSNMRATAPGCHPLSRFNCRVTLGAEAGQDRREKDSGDAPARPAIAPMPCETAAGRSRRAAGKKSATIELSAPGSIPMSHAGTRGRAEPPPTDPGSARFRGRSDDQVGNRSWAGRQPPRKAERLPLFDGAQGACPLLPLLHPDPTLSKSTFIFSPITTYFFADLFLLSRLESSHFFSTSR